MGLKKKYCGYESWTVSKECEMGVDSFEARKLRRKWGSVKESDRL